MSPSATIFDALVVRSVRADPWRVLVAVAALAGGIGMQFAVDRALTTAGASALQAAAVSGRASMSIVAANGLDERILSLVRATDGVVEAAPVVDGAVVVSRGGEAIGVAGRDLVQPLPDDAEPRSVLPSVFDARGDAPFPAELLEESGALLAPPVAARLRLRAGDTLAGTSAGRPVHVKVAGLLRAGTTSLGADGIVVDVATAERLFGEPGRLDRIDCVVAPGRRAGVEARLARILPPGAAAIDADAPGERLRATSERFALALRAAAWLAQALGVLLGYESLATATSRRRRDMAALRALGATRGAIFRAFLAAGAWYGALGALLGLAFGGSVAVAVASVLARAAGAVSPAPGPVVDAPAALAAMVRGVALGLAAAAVPAWLAALTHPASALAIGAGERPPWRRRGRFLGGAALAAAGLTAVAALLPALRHASWAVAAAAVVAAATLLLPAGLAGAAALLQGPGPRSLAAALAGRSLSRTPRRAAGAAAIALVAATLVASTLVFGESLRSSAERWIGLAVSGDLLVYGTSGGGRTGLPRSLVARLASLPGVAAVSPARTVHVPFRSAIVTLEATDLRGFAARLDAAHSAGPAADPRAAPSPSPGSRAIPAIVDGDFARRFGAGTGQAVPLETPAGVVSLRVTGTYEAPAGAGAIVVDEGAYRRLFRDDAVSAAAVTLAPRADAPAVRTRIARMVSTAGGVVEDARARRSGLASALEAPVTLATTLAALESVFALAGVALALAGFVLERRRELALLRLAGLHAADARALVLWQAAGIVAVGTLLGLCAGVVGAAILWTANAEAPVGLPIAKLALVALLAPILSVAAVALPVRAARFAGPVP